MVVLVLLCGGVGVAVVMLVLLCGGVVAMWR